MADRDLLEAAARAAGYTIDKIHQAWRDSLEEGSAGLWLTDGTRCWNPLRNNGDEAMLEAEAELDVLWFSTFVQSSNRKRGVACTEHYADHGGDRQAARRRAGTRAAAALGGHHG